MTAKSQKSENLRHALAMFRQHGEAADKRCITEGEPSPRIVGHVESHSTNSNSGYNNG